MKVQFPQDLFNLFAGFCFSGQRPTWIELYPVFQQGISVEHSMEIPLKNGLLKNDIINSGGLNAKKVVK